MVRYSSVLAIIIIAVPLAISWTQFLIVEDGVFDMIGKRINKLSGKWKKLFTCSVCLSGQLALWIYPILFFDQYSFISHLVAVASSMVIAAFLMKLLEL